MVDDEPDARILVKRVLETCGALVRSAGSGAEATALIALEKPDVLVSDNGMPVENGHELIRRVRQLAPEHGGSVPALALTGLRAFGRSHESRARRFSDAHFQTRGTRRILDDGRQLGGTKQRKLKLVHRIISA